MANPSEHEVTREGTPARSESQAFLDVKSSIMRLAPGNLGVTETSFPYPVFGALMETTIPAGTFIVVSLADGTTSLYMSDGGGTIGGGHHEDVREAARDFLAGAQHYYREASPVATFPSPALGMVSFYFLTADGVRRYDAPEPELEHGRDPLSPLYAAGHGVLGELLKVERALDEQEERARRSDDPKTAEEPTNMADIEIATHELDDPDPERELKFIERMLSKVVTDINKVTTNLGSDFDTSLRLVGYRVTMKRPRDEIVDALRLVTELGVALFERGSVGPNVAVTLSIRGTKVTVAGGVHGYNSAPRWIDATSAAMTLRDREALDRLARFDPASFEGSYDSYHHSYARALVSIHQGRDDDARALLESARAEAAAAKVFPEHGQRFGVPSVEVAQAILAGDAAAFNERLAKGLDWYRTLYDRPDFNHDPSAVVPLKYLGLCALAHDRGLPCRVRSDYIPSWIVDGSFGEA